VATTAVDGVKGRTPVPACENRRSAQRASPTPATINTQPSRESGGSIRSTIGNQRCSKYIVKMASAK
jgi:hypothetical protein